MSVPRRTYEMPRRTYGPGPHPIYKWQLKMPKGTVFLFSTKAEAEKANGFGALKGTISPYPPSK